LPFALPLNILPLLRGQPIVNAIMTAMLTVWHKCSATVFAAVSLGASAVGAVACGVFVWACHGGGILGGGPTLT
jgi:hypothetical protein